MRRAMLLPPLVLVLAACGGASGGLTQAQYDAKVSHLCLLAADQTRELHMGSSVGDWNHYAPSIVRIDKKFANGLAALTPPASLASAAQAYRQATGQAARDDNHAVAAAKEGNAAQLHRAIAQGIKDSLAAQPLAKAIGATGCYSGYP